MREIKFRGYNKECNKWVYWYLVKRDKDWIIVTDAKAVNNRIASVEFYVVDEKSIWQYTWLKDKNWREIYEGDIVKIINKNWSSPAYGVGCLVVISYFCRKWWTYCWFWYAGWLSLTYNKAKWLEIVGNIYENPKLLKDNKINNENRNG